MYRLPLGAESLAYALPPALGIGVILVFAFGLGYGSTLGEGTGMRDRLGLLRIIVPAQEEPLHLLGSERNIQAICKLLIV